MVALTVFGKMALKIVEDAKDVVNVMMSDDNFIYSGYLDGLYIHFSHTLNLFTDIVLKLF